MYFCNIKICIVITIKVRKYFRPESLQGLSEWSEYLSTGNPHYENNSGRYSRNFLHNGYDGPSLMGITFILCIYMYL